MAPPQGEGSSIDSGQPVTALSHVGDKQMFLRSFGDGTAKDWLQVDLQSHHNQFQSADAVFRPDQTNTTSYTEVVSLDDRSALVVYDRIPHGWNAISRDSPQTNSIWVVRMSWTAPSGRRHARKRPVADADRKKENGGESPLECDDLSSLSLVPEKPQTMK